ncbi:hypothetical protein BDZ94DRAFT_1243712 [Collybia nuda]|uniref:Uncharacterized protein n=1 Tax=Collybia nuda TaxID=64659 RepID=A0A9P5YIM7_9AGAR|nr:hypothetical protein BDZ94DRAFT_1243712 [Collybia nuda]
MKGCSFSFTRAKDAERHLKNTTIHDKGAGSSDSSKCCGFCGVVLSRPDARKRHERNGACGKRRSVRQLPRPYLSTPA